MRCQKCNEEYGEKDIQEHHIIPKFMGGTDKNGRILLCTKCHKNLHKKITEFTREWLNNDSNTT